MDAAHAVNGKSRLKEMCFLLLFCRQDVSRSLPSDLLLILSLNLFGSSRGPLTAADLLNDVKEKSTGSPIAVPTAPSSICHDLYIARASKTDNVCVFVGENERMCLCSRSACTDPLSSLSSPVAPPSLPSPPLWKKHPHQTKSLHPDFFRRSNPKKPVLPFFCETNR